MHPGRAKKMPNCTRVFTALCGMDAFSSVLGRVMLCQQELHPAKHGAKQAKKGGNKKGGNKKGGNKGGNKKGGKKRWQLATSQEGPKEEEQETSTLVQITSS